MLTVEEPNAKKVITITVSGALKGPDYQRVMPQLEALFKQHGTLRFYIKLVNFSGFDMGALWQEIKFDAKHMNQYGKTAIVGDKKWEEWATKLSSLFFTPEVKFFYDDQASPAWDWVNAD